MTAKQAIQSLRDRYYLKPTDPVGIVGSFGSQNKAIETGATNRDLIVYATTDDVDLQQEVVVPSGAVTDYFFSNRQIFIDHCKSVATTIGSLRAASRKTVNGREVWQIRIGLYPLKGNPLADDIWTIAQAGGIGVSIGFIPLDYGRPTPAEIKKYTRNSNAPASIVRQWKWLETSITSYPCNVACQTLSTDGKSHASGDDKRFALLDELVTKGQIQRHTARLLGMPDRGAPAPKHILTLE